MTALSMTRAEREAFLADVRIGVLGVERPEGPPSLTPVWYRYAEGVVEIVTASYTDKLDLLRTTGHASLCVQRETTPPAFVTVEGPVRIGPSTPADVEAIASRYVGAENGTTYAEGPGKQDDVLLTLEIDRWRTIDFAKAQ